MQILYQIDISQVPIAEALSSILEGEEKFLEETKEFAKKLAEGTLKHQTEIDMTIKSLSKDWPIERMSLVDRNILRLALYELNYEKETPASVVINEAVELAKKYSTTEAAKFINGVLGGFLKGRET